MLDDVVLWLWEEHNNVNKRLKGDKTEDPAHLKRQFPSPWLCPKCRRVREFWQKDELLQFLVAHYSNNLEWYQFHFSSASTVEVPILQVKTSTEEMANMEDVIQANFTSNSRSSIWRLLNFTHFDLSICFILWAGSIALAIGFCVYFKYGRNGAGKRLLRYYMPSSRLLKVR